MSALKKRLDKKKMNTTDVLICLDPELVKARDRAEAALLEAARQAAKSKDQRLAQEASPAVLAAKAELEAASRKAAEESIVLRFTAVGFRTWNEYMAANPPRQGKQEIFDHSKFFMYVARRTGVYVDERGDAHTIEDSEWDDIEENLTDGEHDRIAGALVDINRVEGLRGLDFLSSSSAETTVSSETSGSREQ